MSGFDLGQIMNVVNNAINAVKTANALIEQLQEGKMVITSDVTQEEIDAAIAKLKEEYDILHENVQNKLRGTTS